MIPAASPGRGRHRAVVATGIAAFVVVLAVVVAFRRPAPVEPAGYGPDTRVAFLAACEGAEPPSGPGAVSGAEVVCGCAYDRIEQTVPYAQFATADHVLGSRPVTSGSAPLPSPFESILVGCLARARLRGTDASPGTVVPGSTAPGAGRPVPASGLAIS